MLTGWCLFFTAVIFCLMFLYAPGYLGARGCGFSGRTSVFIAPVVSTVLLCLIGIVFSKLGISATGWLVLTVMFVLCGLPFLAKALVERGRVGLLALFGWTGSSCLRSIALIALYAGVSFVATVFLYVLPLDGPGSYVQTYDNVHHYGLVQSFLSSGDWSALTSSLYLSDYDVSISPFHDDGGYYPSAWHIVAAVVADVFGVSVPFASNVVNVAFAAFVYPISMCGLISRIFARHRKAAWFGAVCVPAFSAFPWVLLLQWPLYPNFVSMSLFPVSMLLFVEATRRDCARADRARYMAGFVLTMIAFYFAQPNTAFSVAIALIPYCAWRCSDFAELMPARLKDRAAVRIAFALGFVVFAAFIWFALYKAPFLQGVINYQWDAVCTLPEAVESALNLSQNTHIPQYVLAGVVLIGVTGCFFVREYRWVAFSYVLFAVIFVSTYGSEGALKHFLSGFWYTDYYRIAAMMAIVGVVVATYGLFCIFTALLRIIHRAESKSGVLPAIGAAVCLAFAAAVFFPSDGNVYSWLRTNAANIGSSGPYVPFDKDEQEFVDEAREIVGDDELMINQPYDGSMYSYGGEDVNLYYRYISGYGDENETYASRMIREHLCDIASDPEVEKAVESIGADYVLILDESDAVLEANHDYVPEDWEGIERLTDDSPGFEIVLERGGMRLYKITA